MGSGNKIVKYISREELPAFLRQMADAFEQGPAEGEFACLDTFSKFKLAAKDEFGQISVKLKVKSEQECAAEDAETGEPLGKPKYKSLKKRMKSSFKMIFQMLHEGQMPPEAAMRSFIEDSRLMTTYPGYGDPDYPDYDKATDAFEAAFAAGDLPALQEAAHEISSLKGHCHSRYA